MCAELCIKRSELKREPGSLCCVLDIIAIIHFDKRRECSQNASVLIRYRYLCLFSIIVKEAQFDKQHSVAIDICMVMVTNISYKLQVETSKCNLKLPLP